MDTYYLFLDESKPNGHNIDSLCLAGIIIEKEVYEKKIIKAINNLKNEIFSTTDIILHEVDIRNARADYYKLFRKKEVREKFWDTLRNVLSTNECKFIGASIHYTEFESCVGYECAATQVWLQFIILSLNLFIRMPILMILTL